MAHIENYGRTIRIAGGFPDRAIVGETGVSRYTTITSIKTLTSRTIRFLEGQRASIALLLLALCLAIPGRATAAPVFSYALTTTTDPVKPGAVAQFTVTVTNLGTTTQSSGLSFTVPKFTKYGSYAAGATYSFSFLNVPAGVSQSTYVDLTVLSGTQAPPDGTIINLVVSDLTRSASVSRSVTVKTLPAVALDLSTTQGTVAPGGAFAYALSYHNSSGSTISASQLSAPVPVGATFVSADGGGVLGTDGVVRWSPGTLAAGAFGQVHLNLKATTTTGNRAALLVQAALLDSTSHILAQASDTKAIYAAPAFSYALTTTTDPVKPGQVAQFTVTVTNLATTTQSSGIYFHIPNFTKYGSYAAGAYYTFSFLNVPAGASQSDYVDLTVLSGTLAPPNGTIITLDISDLNRSGSVSRSVTIKAAPAVALDLSTTQGTVAPGGALAYALSYHNSSGSTISASQLSAPVPVGATFVSADGGGVLGTDGVVRWSPGTLAAGAFGQVHLNLKATTTTGNRAALLVQAALLDSTSHILAQASDTKAIYAAPAFSYALTTTTDPVKPGQVAQFTVTVTNLSTTTQSSGIYFHIPNFTKYGSYAAGAYYTFSFLNVPAGASRSDYVDLTVLSGAQAPPNGTIITLDISDLNRSGSVSRSVTVKTAPAVALDLSTTQGTVAPGGALAYALSYHNSSGSTISASQLSAPVPVGATFVSADGGGVLGTDGVVRWSPGTLAAGAFGQVHLNLKATTTTGNRAALLMQAALLDSTSHILAQASDTKAIYAAPAFSYALTTTTDPVKPGQVAQFTVTVTNLSTTTQSSGIYFHIPNFTQYGSYAAGAYYTFSFLNVPAGASQSDYVDLTVLSGAQAPPDGTIITLDISDLNRSGSVSRSVTVKAAPAVALDLSTTQGTAAPGATFAYTLSYHNSSGTAISGVQLSAPVPVGSTFVLADGGGVLGTDGVVRWPLGTLDVGASGQVHLNIKPTTTTGNRAALLVQAVLLDSTSRILAQASDTKAIYTAPAFSYAVTTTSDPVKPGALAQFTVTVKNLSATTQSSGIYFHIPNFTQYGSYTAGSYYTFSFLNVPAGASQSTNVGLTVLSGPPTPPDGSFITLDISDLNRAASVSRSVEIHH